MKLNEIRVSYSSNSQKVKISSSEELYKLVRSDWNNDTIELHEEFKIVMLNRVNYVTGIYILSKGGISSTPIDLKLLFSVALKCVASGIILVHNHPSGNLKPSDKDIKVTEKIKQASKTLDIALVDHLIISIDDYYSFADNGML